MRLYYAGSTPCSTRCMRFVCAPGTGVCGFSMMVGAPSGCSCALRRWTGSMCHSSAVSRRQAYTSVSGVVGSGYGIGAGICADPTPHAPSFTVDKCAGAVTTAGGQEQEREIFCRTGTDSLRFRADACPDLPSLMAAPAPAMRACHYMPRSRSTDFGLGSIDFSAAASRPRPRE